MSPKLNMHGRSLLTLGDVSDEEMLALIDLAQDLKGKRKAGIKGNLLERKNIALVFEKMSTRTRCATSIAIAEEGGYSEYLSSQDIHLGKKESAADTARVLGRMFDGILFRGYKQETIELLAKYSGVPVWNGLTDVAHPTQALADLMTVRECFGRLKGLKFVYTGDGRNNVANSLMHACAKAGMSFVNCTPRELAPAENLVKEALETARRSGGSVTIEHQPGAGISGANVICTDVWISMGEEAKRDERIKLLRPYQVNMDLIKASGNIESGQIIFLHCLPAFHDHNTELTRETGAMEVTDEVFESGLSKVFDEAENRMHTIKALLVASLT